MEAAILQPALGRDSFTGVCVWVCECVCVCVHVCRLHCTLCATHVVLVIHIYCTRCQCHRQLRERCLSESPPLQVLAIGSCRQMNGLHVHCPGCCYYYCRRELVSSSSGKKKTLQLQLFDGICKVYTLQLTRVQDAGCLLPVWTFICCRILTALTMQCGTKSIMKQQDSDKCC